MESPGLAWRDGPQPGKVRALTPSQRPNELRYRLIHLIRDGPRFHPPLPCDLVY